MKSEVEWSDSISDFRNRMVPCSVFDWKNVVVVSCLVVGRRIQNVTALLTTVAWGPHVGHPILSSLPLQLQEPDLLPRRPSSPRLPALLPRPELGHRRSSARSGFTSGGRARGGPCSGGRAAAGVPPAHLRAELRPLRLRERRHGRDSGGAARRERREGAEAGAKPHSGPWVQLHPPKKEKPVIALNIWPYMHPSRPSILHPPAQLEATAAHGSIEQATSQDLGAASLLVSQLPSARLCFFSSVLLSCLTPSALPAL